MDKTDFQRVYEKFYDFFFNVANQFLQHEEDAKEVVQEAFISLWEKGKNINVDNEIKNYLFILIRNRSLNILRERKKMFLKVTTDEYMVNEMNYKILNETGEEILLFHELFDEIQQAISSLTPQCREVFKLSRFENNSNKEIAEKLGVSVKAVEANITRALKSLHNDLKYYLSANNTKPPLKQIRTVLLSLI